MSEQKLGTFSGGNSTSYVVISCKKLLEKEFPAPPLPPPPLLTPVLQGHAASLESQLAESRAQVASLESQLAEIEDEGGQSSTVMEDLRKRLIESEDEIASLSMDNDDMQRKAAAEVHGLR